jgi:hypothetical protein
MKASTLIQWLQAAQNVTNSDPEVKVSIDDCESLFGAIDVWIGVVDFIDFTCLSIYFLASGSFT